jgi:proteasome lid subunit RPN8/RPN11
MNNFFRRIFKQQPQEAKQTAAKQTAAKQTAADIEEPRQALSWEQDTDRSIRYDDGSNRHWGKPKVSDFPNFELSAEVSQRFNAYAQAAFPNEIGGMLRVVQQEDGSWLACDLKIFKQRVNGAYFELDPQAVALFNMDLYRTGRKDEISQWRALIHSHPAMTPFMSGPDRENIERLAGERFAFSVICSAYDEPEKNYYAVHYAQKSPQLMIHDMPVYGDELHGTDGLTQDEIDDIREEVQQLTSLM